MPSELAIRLWTGAGIALVPLGCALLLALGLRGAPRGGGADRPHRAEWLLCLLLLALGAYLRIADLDRLHGGRLTGDEAHLDRIYLFQMLTLQPSFNGGTYLTHALLLDLWHHAFGFTPLAGRHFSAAVGALGLVFFFLAMRATLGLRPALWGTALLSIALYAVYFASFALEPIHALCFPPLLAWLGVRCRQRPSLGRGLALGIALGLSLFTYPGLLVGLASVAAGWLLAALGPLGRRGLAQPGVLLAHLPWRVLLGAALASGALLAAGAGLHERYYGAGGGFLFRGGGGLDPSPYSWASALAILLRDAFVETATWNLPYRHAPFLEWTFWPLALAGGVLLWRRHGHPAGRGLVLSIPIALAVLPFTGATPGMRRGVFLLLPVTALAGLGAAWAFRRLGPLRGSLLLGALVAQPLVYDLALGRGFARQSNFLEDFGAAPIADAVLLDQLRRHGVLVSSDEFAHEWDRRRVQAFPFLARRYGVLDTAHDVRLLAEADPAFLAGLTDGSGAVAATWQPAFLLRSLARAQPLCFQVVRPVDADGPAFLRVTSPGAAGPQDVCLGGTPERLAPTPCARLGANHVQSMLAHRVECSLAGCSARHMDHLFAHPGAISLELKPPPDAGRGPLWIAFRILYSQVDQRENFVTLNDRPVGMLDERRLRQGERAALEVPARARRRAGSWLLRVGPTTQPGKLGWDLYWAALVKPGPGEPLDDAIARVEREACGPP